MKIAICDDERLCIEAVITCIENYMAARKAEIEYEAFERYPDLEPRIDEFDVFVMDYQTPEIDGLTFAAIIREKYGDNKAIIFVTSFPDIVYESFAVRTHRFLVKPINEEKFFEALDSYLKTDTMTRRFVITSDGETDVVDTDDILYIEVDQKSVFVYTAENQYICRRSIASVEEELTNLGFFRVHRSYLVNMRNIAHFSNDTIELKNGEKIPVSKRNHKSFCKEYLKFMKK